MIKQKGLSLSAGMGVDGWVGGLSGGGGVEQGSGR